MRIELLLLMLVGCASRHAVQIDYADGRSETMMIEGTPSDFRPPSPVIKRIRIWEVKP